MKIIQVGSTSAEHPVSLLSAVVVPDMREAFRVLDITHRRGLKNVAVALENVQYPGYGAVEHSLDLIFNIKPTCRAWFDCRPYAEWDTSWTVSSDTLTAESPFVFVKCRQICTSVPVTFTAVFTHLDYRKILMETESYSNHPEILYYQWGVVYGSKKK